MWRAECLIALTFRTRRAILIPKRLYSIGACLQFQIDVRIGDFYFRTTPYFETSSEKYGWMNRICSIASGSLSANARMLDVFQVL